jgi:hypothetical protein
MCLECLQVGSCRTAPFRMPQFKLNAPFNPGEMPPLESHATPCTFSPWPSWPRRERTSEFDPTAGEHCPWNGGRKVGAKRALKPRQVWAIRFFSTSTSDCGIERCLT